MTETLFVFDQANYRECQSAYRGERNQEYYLGDYVIEAMDETHRAHLADGTPRKIEFSLDLLRVGDEAPEAEGDAA